MAINWTVTDQWQEGEDVVYDYRRIWGIKPLMNGNESCLATFGYFEVVGRHVIHSTYNGDSDMGYDEMESCSEFLDDLNDLKKGHVRFI